MRSPFLDRLSKPEPLLFDGAMGTQLYGRGVPYERCFDELNRLDPAIVLAVHSAYIRAGADVIESNTFAANRAQLARFGLADAVRDLNLRGVRIAREAREACGQQVFLAGSVSSIGQPIGPSGAVSLVQARSVFVEQIEALLEGGVDLLVLETFGSVAELRVAVDAAQSVSTDLPIVASVSLLASHSATAHDPSEQLQLLDELDVAAVGVNCGGGPREALDAVRGLSTHAGRPLAVMPNAGYPSLIGGRHQYVATPTYFAEYATRFLDHGIRLVGGCCGTGPDHIAAMREALDQWLSSSSDAPPESLTTHDAAGRFAIRKSPVVASSEGSPLSRKLQNKAFIISVEVDPPRGLQPRKMLDGASSIRAAGADCIDIGDSPMARVRMSCIAFAALVERQIGLETLIHFTTRDRNAMALQSDLLGAHALGVRNVIALTGDPPNMANSPTASAVWDVDSIGLIKIIKQLNQGTDWTGNSIGQPTSFLVACAVNPMASDLDLEVERYWAKVAAGADFAITQPLYDMEQLDRFLRRVPRPPIPTIIEIMPLQSYKHAEFCHNELAGVVIPKPVLRDMHAAGERGIEVGLRAAREFLESAGSLVEGVLLVPSFHRYEMVNELVQSACELRNRVHSPDDAERYSDRGTAS